MIKTPKPSIEILVARLINDLAQDGAISDEELASLDEAELFRRYAEQGDYPNRTTEQSMHPPDERYTEIERELGELMAGKTGQVDLTEPHAIKDHLDLFVEGQDDAKKLLATAIVDYLQHGLRQGILLMGPSGSGKTYSLEIIAKLAGIPFVKKSLANVTAAGFKNQNLSEGLEGLLGAKKGILFLDEFDKIADTGEFRGFGPQLQRELLAYFTGEKIKLTDANPAPKAPIFTDGAPGAPIKPLADKAPVEPPLTATVYNTAETIIDDAGQGGQVKAYLSSLMGFFRENSIQATFKDLTSGFEEWPPELANLLGRRRLPNRAYPGGLLDPGFDVDDYARGQTTRDQIPCLFAVEIGGRYYRNPKRADLEAVLAGLKKGPARDVDDLIDEQTEKPPALMDEPAAAPEDPPNVIDLGKILVVAAGAFHGNRATPSLYRIVQRRLGGNTCKLDETELLNNVEDRDLIEYGLIPELVGRLTARRALKPHDIAGLYRILKFKEDSPIDALKKVFKEIGITLSFDDPALLLLAEYAHQGIGVRGVHKILSQATQDYSFDRSSYIGRTLAFTRSGLESLLKKQVVFELRDGYEVDWQDISSIMGFLDLYVPNQKDTKMELARAFHLYHVRSSPDYKHLSLPMSNVLLAGTTGSGKTYMVELLAKKAGLPIASTNATGKVPEGVAGTQLSTVFDQFSETQKEGIVYIDEADKPLLDVGNPLNQELIGFIEKGEVRGRKTDNYLFILSGAFQDIYNAKRAHGQDRRITREDLIACGVREELLGRIPILVNVEPPTVTTMTHVLNGPDSVITHYANYFSTQGVKLDLEEGVVRLIAERAIQSNLGFRALKTVCGELFRGYMVNLRQHAKDGRLTVRLDDASHILKTPATATEVPDGPIRIVPTGYAN